MMINKNHDYIVQNVIKLIISNNIIELLKKIMSNTTENISTVPWVEKYRPVHFDNIVLDPLNRQIFKNILNDKYFPNLLFYGPPGTGKTTTIINLIRDYQAKYNNANATGQNANATGQNANATGQNANATGQKSIGTFSGNGTIIHLNASDERGIDIIRNQIYQFVKSKSLFETGLKFVILDEVDYMTKNAQQALKYLLQSSLYNVRFCLICNYISKIDESLKNEFVSIRFNQLPDNEIFHFLKKVAEKESIDLTDTAIRTIQTLYQSDIRSMINFIQLNRAKNIESMVMTNAIYKTIYEMAMNGSLKNTKSDNIIQYIHDISIRYNTDKRTIINRFFNYMIRNYRITSDFLTFAEIVVHSKESTIQNTMMFFANELSNFSMNPR